MTNDERREVAARLREDAEKRGVTLDYLGSEQVASWWLLLHSIGCDSNSQDVAFNLLADLIDPTCAMEYGGYLPESVKGMLGVYFCSECGSPIYNDVEPAYCPYCGARVVSGDGE